MCTKLYKGVEISQLTLYCIYFHSSNLFGVFIGLNSFLREENNMTIMMRSSSSKTTKCLEDVKYMLGRIMTVNEHCPYAKTVKRVHIRFMFYYFC